MKMNKLLFLALYLCFGATLLSAQTPHAKYDYRTDHGRKNFLLGLRSNNDGVIETALMLVMQLRMKEPSLSLAELYPVIDSISVHGSNPILCYKAQLAAQVCKSPEDFSELKNIPVDLSDIFFVVAAQKLQQKLLGLSSL